MKQCHLRPMAALHCVMLVVSVIAGTGTASAQTFPANFNQVLVADQIAHPTTMAFAADGRIFVAQQNGVLAVVKNGNKLTTPALRLGVDFRGERGLIGITLHPEFPANGFVYLYFTVPDGTRNRVSRFTMTGDVIDPSSELIILNLDSLSTAKIHNGGAMRFNDDKLYIAVGDNANGSNAQNLDTYHGKLLRVNADGSAPADNPFNVPDASDQRKRVWAYGLRNPFTFDVQAGTGRVFVNDVGLEKWEEINDATAGGLNFGWPASEGPTAVPGFTSPVFSYPQGSGGGQGCAITGGVFLNHESTNYPSALIGKYFYQDLCNGWINYLDLSSGAVSHAFATGLPGQALSLELGSDGNLYYLSRHTRSLYKIIFSQNASPAILDEPDDITVSAGQSATFYVTAAGAAPLHYQWKKDNVNISGATSATLTIAEAQPSDAGNYHVVVSNAAGSATSQVATLTVGAFNAPPTAQITMPLSGAMYRGGDIISFAGSAADPEDGTLPASAFTWLIVFHHESHVHDGPPIAQGVTSGSFSVPNSGETSADVFYRLHLIVTDSKGLADTATLDIMPHKSNITLNSNPAGLTLSLDGQPVETPYTTLGVQGITRTIDAMPSQTMNGIDYIFTHWTHGGATTQTISTPVADTTYTANYSASNLLPSPWLTTNIGNVGLTGGASFSSETFTIEGSGNDMSGTADAFRYAYQVVSGDTDIRARVNSVTYTDASAKAGVMIRETLHDNSKYAMVAVTPDKGVAFQQRPTTGGTSQNTGSSGTAPYWVRLSRTGSTFTAYSSMDGSSWNEIGSTSISMTSDVLVGLAVTSNHNTLPCTAGFDNVTVTGEKPPENITSTLGPNEHLPAVSLFPNPLEGDVLNIESSLPLASPVRIRVVDMLGHLIHEQDVGMCKAGVIRYQIDMSRLARGAYIVRIHSTGGSQAAMLIKR